MLSFQHAVNTKRIETFYILFCEIGNIFSLLPARLILDQLLFQSSAGAFG